MLKFKRKKNFNFINSFFYYLDKFLPFTNKSKLKLYLNLSFIFNRLSHEKSYLLLRKKHPQTKCTIKILKKIVKKNFTICDIGSGNGYIANALSQYVKKIICIDYDKKAILLSKKNNKKKENISYICTDIKYLKRYNIKKIDLIICSHVIEHLKSPFIFLNNLKKLNSKIYIEVPDFESNPLSQVKKIFSNSLNYSDEDHIYEFDRESLKKNILKEKFIILEEIYQNGVISLLIK